MGKVEHLMTIVLVVAQNIVYNLYEHPLLLLDCNLPDVTNRNVHVLLGKLR